jgi:hypothetical protein
VSQLVAPTVEGGGAVCTNSDLKTDTSKERPHHTRNITEVAATRRERESESVIKCYRVGSYL